MAMESSACVTCGKGAFGSTENAHKTILNCLGKLINELFYVCLQYYVQHYMYFIYWYTV